jgi:flagellar hook-associated protein 1 FlgK
MGGLLAALNSSKTGLLTSQKLIEITGNNITNVNTPGYSRQKGTLAPVPALEFNGYFIGQGVKVDTITREYDAFLTSQLRSKNSSFGTETGKSSPLAEIERLVNISDQNLSSEIDRFFDAWQGLSANPGGPIERDMVIQQGNLIADAFLNTALSLDRVKEDINTALVAKIDVINSQLAEVADLNYRIANIEATGQSANADQDRRDLLLEELSFSLGVKSYTENGGMVTLILPGGQPLVQLDMAYTLTGTQTGNGLSLSITDKNTSRPLDLTRIGGEFQGLLTVRDQIIPDLQSSFDTMAYSFVTEVNAQHQVGVGLDGLSHLFFNDIAVEAEASKNMTVAITDTSEVAAGATMAPGDNTNALLIAAIREKKIVNGTDTLSDAYGKAAATIGIESNRSQLSLAATEDSLNQLQNMRSSAVGVSIEEEMINLIQYQSAFEASAKFLATVDQMMAILLAIKQ